MPLPYRVPNPPPLFVGRERDIAALNAAIAQFPVAVVCGPGGVGKTALALQWLAQRGDLRPEHAMLIELRSGEPAEDPRVQIIHALARSRDVGSMAWGDILRDDDSIGGTLIDLSEAVGGWILLDDLHNAPLEAASALLSLLSRYARKCRWIMTSRTPPQLAELATQVLTLGGLDEPALRRLCAATAPELSEAEVCRAVEASGGSPWALRRLVTASTAPGEDRLLGGLSPGALEFLQSLASVDQTLSLDALRTFAPVPSDDVMQMLLGRGLIQRNFKGLRIHDVVGRMLRAAASQQHVAESAKRIGGPLAGHRDLEAAIEGIRLLLRSGGVDQVCTSLERCGAQLVEQGHAPRLWQLLQLSDDGRLDPWRLRCAVSIGEPGLVARLTPPSDSEPLELRALWVRALLIQYRYDEACALAERLREEASAAGEPALAEELAMASVMGLSIAGRKPEALALLSALAPAAEASAQVLRDSWRVHLLARLERLQEAELLLGPLWASRDAQSGRVRGEVLSGRVRGEVLHNLVSASFLLGRVRDAYDASCAALQSCIPSAQSLLQHAACAAEAARYDVSARTLLRLEPFVPEKLRKTGGHLWYRIDDHIATEGLAGVDVALASLKKELRLAGRVGHVGVLASVLGTEVTCRCLRGEPPAPLEGEDEALPIGAWNTLHHVHWRVRAGESLPVGFGRDGDCPRPALDWVIADALIGSGDAVGALDACTHALQDVVERGWREMEIKLRLQRCDILLILGRWEALGQECAALEALATDACTTRFQREAQFYTAFCPDAAVGWGALEKIAGLVHVAPIGSRRARVLLGESALLDAVDRRVLAAIHEHRGPLSVTTLQWGVSEHPQRLTAPWGVEASGRRVWSVEGANFSLADKPQLWRILSTLIERGGEVSKEQLVLDVWDVAKYHPLKDDNRLHVAIRKLRGVLEADPSKPARLLTTPDGYALVGPMRFVRAA